MIGLAQDSRGAWRSVAAMRAATAAAQPARGTLVHHRGRGRAQRYGAGRSSCSRRATAIPTRAKAQPGKPRSATPRSSTTSRWRSCCSKTARISIPRDKLGNTALHYAPPNAARSTFMRFLIANKAVDRPRQPAGHDAADDGGRTRQDRGGAAPPRERRRSEEAGLHRARRIRLERGQSRRAAACSRRSRKASAAAAARGGGRARRAGFRRNAPRRARGRPG